MSLEIVWQGMTVRHTDTGNEYRVIAIAQHGRKLSNKPPVVVYIDTATSRVFWREMDDFLTGEFEELGK